MTEGAGLEDWFSLPRKTEAVNIMDWKVCILQGLRVRNQKESVPFRDLVTSCECVLIQVDHTVCTVHSCDILNYYNYTIQY